MPVATAMLAVLGAAIGFPPVQVDAHAPALAQRLDNRRLTAVVQLSGRAVPGTGLLIAGSCGRVDCDGLTYTDATGRWQTRLRLTTPRGRRDVVVRVAYDGPARSGEPPAAVRVRLGTAPPAAAPAPLATLAPVIFSGGVAYPVRRTLVVIGDSLAIGAAQPLADLLHEWDVDVDARVGRPLAEGMDILSATSLPSTTTRPIAAIAFSLFTNDAPTDVDALEAAVRASVVHVGPQGCAIWATISRPAVHGVSYRAANERLNALAADAQLAGHLVVVPWAEQVALHHDWKAADHVHATALGYIARAQLYAAAARECPGMAATTTRRSARA